MIKAYVGVPGSGKSLHTMADLYWACRRKDSLIMTNFALDPPRGTRAEVARLPIGRVSVEDVLEVVRDWLQSGHVVTREGQILVVIDEAQLTYNNRSWQEAGRDEWIRLFIQHRKLGMSFVLVVQDLGMIDKQIRSMIEVSVSHLRANSYGVFGDLVSLLFIGRPVILAVFRLPYYGTSKAGIIRRDLIIGRKCYFRMYDTHAMFSDDSFSLDVWGGSSAEAVSAGRLEIRDES